MEVVDVAIKCDDDLLYNFMNLPMRINYPGLIVLSGFVLSIFTKGAEAAPLFRVTEIPVPAGSFVARAYALNDTGTVVGGVRSYENYQEMPYVWEAKYGTKLLNSLPTGQYGTALGVNNHGTVVGIGNTYNASIWTSDSGFKDLGAFTTTQEHRIGEARAINDAGTVVGWSDLVDPVTLWTTQRAFIWTEATGMRDLGAMGGTGFSSAYAINQHGDVVGTLLNSASRLYGAALWRSDGSTIELGTLPSPRGAWAHAEGINERGQVVGFSTSWEGSRAFLWTQELGMVSLGALPGFERESAAYDINNRGQAVGISYGDGWQVPFLWSEIDGMLDLNDLISPDDDFYGRLSLTRAYGINETGAIAVSGPYAGDHRAFLLTPVEIPEPGPIGLFSFGIAMLIWARRRQENSIVERT